MGFDIYGEPLKRGHCEVHPNVAEEYPCELCLREKHMQDIKDASNQHRQLINQMQERIYQLSYALKIQALRTAYYNGHGKPHNKDLKAKYPTGELLWQRYMCDEGKGALGLNTTKE